MKMKLVASLLLCSFATLAAAQAAAPTPQDADREKRIAWWRDARFGMFIHWGVYSVPAGEWKGQPIAGIGEWIMNHAKIPVAEYEQLPKQFNPVKFNADEWVAVAKAAGMKYIVITSKHHDGFAMYGSKASKYNIVDATPFHRDPLKELAAAASKAGIKLGFYYSQTQDWHEYDAEGNTWDWPEPDPKKDFAKYFEAKCKPQVKEILTGYGPLAEIWFDTPRDISKAMSLELVKMVHELNPMCLVDGRVGNGVGDYDSAGDNQISGGNFKRDWETPVTLNDTWGFKKDDNNWKSPAVLVQQLAKVAGRNGNYLLNVGPTSEGVIPAPSVERLAEVGKWMQVNGDSIYGTNGSPLPYDLPWGPITVKPGKIFLHVFDWPKEGMFTFYGLKTKVTRAYLLADTSKPLAMQQDHDPKIDHHSLTLRLPKTAPDALDSVVVLDTAGPQTWNDGLLQQPDGSITLPANLALVEVPEGAKQELRFDTRGVAEHWTNPKEHMSWGFRTSTPGGRYNVLIITSQQKYGTAWEGGHHVTVEVAGGKVDGFVTDDLHLDNPSNPYWPYVESRIGTLELGKAGPQVLTLKPEMIESAKKLGFTLVAVRLQRTR